MGHPQYGLDFMYGPPAEASPATTVESENLSRILVSLVNAESSSEHFRAVQALCGVILDFYLGVLTLVGHQNGLAAQALVRSLFETVVSAIILAKSPHLLSTFLKHGKFTHLRTLHFAKSDVNEEAGRRRIALHAKYKVELDSLFAEFGENAWHGMKTADSFEAAGFERSLHGRYYRSASAIAHGQPHSVVRVTEDGGCSIGRTSMGRMNSLYGAYIMSSLIIIHFLEQLNSIFDLNLSQKLADCRMGVDVWKARHIELFRHAANLHNNNNNPGIR
jgi:Family of unknown function (DUF5677)